MDRGGGVQGATTLLLLLATTKATVITVDPELTAGELPFAIRTALTHSSQFGTLWSSLKDRLVGVRTYDF